jgi:hypothetical protein
MLANFYQSLPRPGDVPGFYIHGYTEALKYFSGVRVVPHSTFIEGTDAMQFKRYFMALKSLPVYFIPIFQERKTYGFVLKSGAVKFTPKFCTCELLPGCERVKDRDTVFMAEGIKDVGPLLMAGYKAVPMLTAIPSVGLLKRFKGMGCKVVIIPDCDTHLREHVKRMGQRFKEAGYEGHEKDFLFVFLDNPDGAEKHDLGEYYDPGLPGEIALGSLKKIVKTVKAIGW